jgi:hypothetical protein
MSLQVRVLRVSSTFEVLENYFPHGLLTIFKFFLLMLAIGHVTACLFYFMAVLDNLDGLSWPAKVSAVIAILSALPRKCSRNLGDVNRKAHDVCMSHVFPASQLLKLLAKWESSLRAFLFYETSERRE